MKTLYSVILWVVGLVSVALTAYYFFEFTKGQVALWMPVLFFVIFCICAFLYFFTRPKEEDISITK